MSKESTPVQSVVAFDGTGGDSRDTRPVVEAVRFALAMYPQMYIIVFGSNHLSHDLAKSGVDDKRYEFRLAQQAIPQDEVPRSVLKHYTNSAMYQALKCLKSGEAHAMLSSGGTGPLVSLARHILGVQTLSDKMVRAKEDAMGQSVSNQVRPCFAARIPSGPERFALMLDLGANASCTIGDLYDFAVLGRNCSQILLGEENPRVALLNVGTELGKGNALVKGAKILLEHDKSLFYTGFIEANRIFCDDADVIVTDGFSGNIALKAAEGVADLYSGSSGIKKFFGRLSRPEWLLPWQYNGSLLLGVNGIVVKSHASAGKEALAVAMVEAARAASNDLALKMQKALSR